MSSVTTNAQTIAADTTLTVKGIRAKPNKIIDTTGGIVTATLPANPPEGLRVYFRREGGNDAVVGRNGNTINGAAADVTLDTDLDNITLEFNSADWKTHAVLDVP